MSRIDEALRRIKQGGDDAPPETQIAFKPAWTVTDDGVGPAERSRPASEHSRLVTRTRVGPDGPAALSFASSLSGRLASAPDGDPGLIEQFRRLAGTLHHAQQSTGIRSVMVTSATPGDGKTLTAINLALVLAESYRYDVLLVDADLRRPSIPALVDLGEGSGLSDALRAATERKLALVPVTAKLTLLPAGEPIANSIEALTSPRMRQILEEASVRFDWVILDAPPVGPTADARLLAEMVGGTLFVIRAGQTQYQAVQRAVDTLGRDQILGVVLNGVDGVPDEGYYGVARGESKA